MLRMGFMPVFNADEGNGGTVPTPSPAPPTQAAPTPDDKQGEQYRAELDRVAKSARRDGEKDAAAKLLADLGAPDIETVRAKLQAMKAKEDAELSESERLKKQLDDLQAKVNEAEAKAQQAERKALEKDRDREIERSMGNAKYPQMIMAWLRESGKLESTITADGTIDKKAIESAVAECKKEAPDLFRSDNPGSPSHAGAQPQNLNAEALKKAADEMRQRARL